MADELDKTIEELEAELVELRRKFDVKKRKRDAKIEALEFAKFLKKL